MLILCYGPLGLKPWELARLSYVDLVLMLRGRERVLEDQWAHTRELIAAMNNTAMGAKKRNLRGKDIIKLSFDEPDVSDEQAALMFYEMAKSNTPQRGNATNRGTPASGQE